MQLILYVYIINYYEVPFVGPIQYKNVNPTMPLHAIH